MSAETDLAVVPPKETALTVFSTANGLDPWLQQVRAKVDEFNKVLPDLTTRKGREAYASMAHQIAKSKTALEAVGKEISAKQKEIPKLIDAERKRVWDTLESWQKEVRKPLDDWQAAEDARVAKHNDGIQQIKDMALFGEMPPASVVARVITDLEAIAIDDSWEEFLAEAAQAKDQALAKLRALLAERNQYEAEQSELVRLRAEAEAQAQRDRDAEIARVAAEQARLQAEQQAQAERDAAARREQELLDQAAATQRAAAQAALDAEAAAERQRLQLELQAEQARTAAAQAEASRVAAEQRAEQERIAAIKRQEEAVEQARIAEQARADAAADEILRQAEAREADLEHKKSINRAALEAFIAGGMPEACAKQAVTLIAQRKIPAITISY
ncbi:hypothetical protein [Pseudomonas proteolytica]|uniref:hypothetical protein n=1 Tax=Pseudomonas proteolytica TaxID=219574 RepID=UPI00089B6127|nr:hypothetical protein [Pseudomonas proteolytica]KAA8702425.1 hypothetical protein F4W61_11445 [Pseudomonas proteolytica]TWR76275.1 hypothetical protein FIV38_24160 [Pseudomonas proteolytica]SEE79480.1 hypothetical protein SAMN04490200_5472 [Pseudomonas proteolytica]